MSTKTLSVFQPERASVPSKDDEISILSEATRQLGPHSYCGPWLAQQLDGIARDIRSDFFPQIDVNATRRQCEEELKNATDRAAQIVDNAEKAAASLRQKCHTEIDAIRHAAIRQLQQVTSKLEQYAY